MEKVKGKIISINKDLYTVSDGNSVFPCSVRGKLRGFNLTVGDNVIIDNEKLVIESVLERKNTLIRPLVSNIDKLFIVVSTKIPDFSTYLLDKFLVLASINNITPIIIVTKLDLLNRKELKNIINTLKYYKKIGYKVYTNKEIRKIVKEIKGCVISLAGQTGAGKSSLLNKIDSSLNLQVGEVSTHLGRGKHTTRLARLINVKGGLVADTPGFSSLEIEASAQDINQGFIEFGYKCKYKSCTHIKNDGCFVIERVEKGKILKSRYESYLKLINEVKK